MRCRYLLVLGPACHREQKAPAPDAAALALGLTERLEGAGFLLFHDAALPVQQLTQNAFVCGRVLPGRTGKPIAAQAEAIAASGGRLLIEEYWGDYIACFADQAGAAHILRAPSGGLHAYHATVRGAVFAASDVALLVDTGIVAATPDWTFVAQHLRFKNLVGALTGIAGVREVFPGSLETFGAPASERRLLWSPWAFSEPQRQQPDFATAAAAVNETVTEAVRALTAPYSSPLLELSGGLDSSVLAAACAGAAIPARAVNLVTAESEGDERAFARATAAHTGLALSEIALPSDFDLTSATMPRIARPGMPLVLSEADQRLKAAGLSLGADAFLSGSGGDSVFCSLGSPAPVADVIKRRGGLRRLVRTIGAVALIHNVSMAKVAGMAWRQVRRGPLHQHWKPAPTFLNRDVVPAEPQYHPWFDEPAHALPGMRSHIRILMATLAHLDGYAREAIAPCLFPLLSQPVMEACLRIPSWLWVEGGRDRAVAREAFRASLPDSVIARRSKGKIDAYCVRNFLLNIDRIRSYLLDGHLLGSGLIDRAALESAIAPDATIAGNVVYTIFPMLDMEAWLRAWSSPVSGPAMRQGSPGSPPQAAPPRILTGLGRAGVDVIG